MSAVAPPSLPSPAMQEPIRADRDLTLYVFLLALAREVSHHAVERLEELQGRYPSEPLEDAIRHLVSEDTRAGIPEAAALD